MTENIINRFLVLSKMIRKSQQEVPSRHIPFTTETRVVKQLDKLSQNYLTSLGRIHYLRRAKMNEPNAAVRLDLISARKIDPIRDSRHNVTYLAKITKYTRNVMELLEKTRLTT